jgi:hypothetical protein
MRQKPKLVKLKKKYEFQSWVKLKYVWNLL